jgi:hypothetical protein
MTDLSMPERHEINNAVGFTAIHIIQLFLPLRRKTFAS